MKNHFLWLSLLPLLAACQGNDVRNALGLEREAPDEFVIYSRPPLSLPPEFELRPPRPGEPPREGKPSRDKARSAVFGENAQRAEQQSELIQPAVETAVTPVISSDAKSTADAHFLSRAKADAADPEIREKLNHTEGPDTSEAKSLFEKIVKSDGKEPIVDGTKEVERLRKNKQQGKPVTEGEVPTIDPSPKTLIDKIL